MCEVIVFTSAAELITRHSKSPPSNQFTTILPPFLMPTQPVYTVFHIEKCALHAHVISESSKTRSSSVLPTEVGKHAKITGKKDTFIVIVGCITLAPYHSSYET